MSFVLEFEFWPWFKISVEGKNRRVVVISAKNHKRQRRKRQTRKVANAKVLNRNTNLT